MPAPNWNATDWGGGGQTAWDVDGVTPLTFDNSGSPDYSDITYRPSGTWVAGFRPGTVTIDLLAPDGFFEYATPWFRLNQTSGPSVEIDLTGATFPYVLDASIIVTDILSMIFEDVHGAGRSVTVTSVVFTEAEPCQYFWTSFVKSTESCNPAP